MMIFFDKQNLSDYEFQEFRKMVRSFCKDHHLYFDEDKNMVYKHKPNVVTSVFIQDNCPDGYWYSKQQGKKFNIKTCDYSDLYNIEGFNNKEPNECWKVIDEEFKGNIIDKKHCITM